MFDNLKLSNPLAVLDLETTGTDYARDRIVEIALVLPVELFEVVALTALVTKRSFEYAKKLAAVKNTFAVSLSGAPNVLTSSVSLVICFSSRAGPHLKAPAIAPVDTETPGTDAVKSISDTFMPGET